MIRALLVMLALGLAACERADGARGAYVGGGVGASRLSN
jgi:hypothetical protein